MSLKMQLQKYKNFLIPPKDFLANFGFPLAKVAKSQSLISNDNKSTRQRDNKTCEICKDVSEICGSVSNLFPFVKQSVSLEKTECFS